MRESLSGVAEENVCIIEEEAVEIGDINICAFAISHDAANPVGYTLVSENEKVSVATDTGIISENMLLALCGSDKVMIEANHDPSLLAIGSYPEPLKRRIRGDKGHLCNEKAGELALCLMKEGTRKFILGHLSEENNHPDLAYVTVKEILCGCGAREGIDFEIRMAHPSRTGEII
jgi:phosphoribosyl 1,2-cyclic phosphodiesterase